jgi:hypothetical protein
VCSEWIKYKYMNNNIGCLLWLKCLSTGSCSDQTPKATFPKPKTELNVQWKLLLARFLLTRCFERINNKLKPWCYLAIKK